MNVFNHRRCSFATIVEIPKDRIDKVDFALCRQPTESLETFYSRQIVKPHILTNGGFFNMSSGETVFNFVDERKSISSTAQYKWGLSVIKNQLTYGHLDKMAGISDFVSGYPNLIDNGEKVLIDFAKEINYRARRTVLGYNDDSIFIVIVDSPGVKFADLQTLLTTMPRPMKFAINLDGGGSSRLLLDGKLESEDSWSRPVDNVVAIYLNEPKPQLVYRVQAGAFQNKENAEKLKDQIITLSDPINAGYKNAYVRYVNDLYRVQIGAFSIKGSAEKVKAHLKELNRDSFIVSS